MISLIVGTKRNLCGFWPVNSFFQAQRRETLTTLDPGSRPMVKIILDLVQTNKLILASKLST